MKAELGPEPGKSLEMGFCSVSGRTEEECELSENRDWLPQSEFSGRDWMMENCVLKLSPKVVDGEKAK